MAESFIKINIKGGILSPGDLLELTNLSRLFRIPALYFGERQNIFLRTYLAEKELVSRPAYFSKFDYEINTGAYPNIVSSYVSEDIFSQANNWLSEGHYKDVLDSFDFKPRLKVNIVDNTQALVPLFTGELNFISSSQSNFWYLYINHPSLDGLTCWPDLVYSQDIPTFIKSLETELSQQKTSKTDLNTLIKQLYSTSKVITMPAVEKLALPRLRFPNYEGMNRQGDSYWLGIYRRNNDFSVDFLEKVAGLCMESKIGALYITPFKSLIIKGIKEEDRLKWEKLLGKFGINIRHSASELNWQLRDSDNDGLKLKTFLARQFDLRDVRTYGLTFAVKTAEMDIFTSVIIEKKYHINLFGKLRLLPYYNIYYKPDFDPHTQKTLVFSENRTPLFLVDDLFLLCQKYYSQLTKENPSIPEAHALQAKVQPEIKESDALRIEKDLYECEECHTLYDSTYGDPRQSIVPHTPFHLLPGDYKCPVCEAKLSAFRAVTPIAASA